MTDTITNTIVIEEKFRSFLEEFRACNYNNPLIIPPEIWASPAWETVDKNIIEEIFTQFIKFAIERAKITMPLVYKKAYDDRDISGNTINTMQDFWSVPILVKDATINGISFREKVKENPFIL